MPLSELYRMAKGKLESTIPENDLFELIWQNGQILKQGQSSRGRKIPASNNFQSHCLPSYTPKTRDKDIGYGTNSKMGKFGGMESILNEIPMSVPSDEMDLSQDDDIMPWLNYPIDESLHEYGSEFLPEISGVTVNEPSTQNNLASIDKRSSCNLVYRDCHTDSVNDGVSLGQGNVSKVSSAGVGEATRPRTSTCPLYPSSSPQYQTSFSSLRSRVSDVTGNNTSNVMHRAVCGDPTQVASAAGGFPSIKMQKKDPMLPSNNSNLMNFSHFSRPAALVKANLQNMGLMAGSDLSSMGRMESKDKGSAASSKNPPEPTLINSIDGLQKESSSQFQPLAVPSKVDLKPLEDKPVEEPVASKQSEAFCQEDASKNDKSSNPVVSESATKGLPDGEKTTEPVVAASSVCSGNSVEGASDDPSHNLKRKCRDTEESDCHSDDLEEESVGAKKAAPARGGTGSKRSRAAEVHNLSERRRRDRINEKMRALQELIPNCNKVDKASMLDEAIEYLKTLQLQVQIMSMGSGFYMPPMMLPTGMQHMGAPHMAHYSPMGIGMGMGMGMGLGMGYGMGIPDMNVGSSGYPMIQVPPMQGAHFPGPPISGHAAMHGMTGSNLQMFGLPGQGLPMSMPCAPLIPLSGEPLMKSATGMNACGTVGPVGNVDSAPASSSKDQMQNVNSQVMQVTGANSSMAQTSSQCPATNAGFEPSSLVQNNGQVSYVTGNAAVNSTNGNALLPSRLA